MNKLEFEDWCREQQVATHTIDLIALLRKSPPSRRVPGRTKKVCGVYPSSKMGVTIQFESNERGIVGDLPDGTRPTSFRVLRPATTIQNPVHDPKVKTTKRMHKDHGMSIAHICQILKISSATFYRYIAILKAPA